MSQRFELLFLVFAGAALALNFSGCSETATPPSHVNNPDASTKPGSAISAANETPGADEEHGHKAGAHGGIIVSLGRDSYHVEAVFEAGNKLRLYTLGNDESRVIDIEVQSLSGFAKAEGENDAMPFELEPQPQQGDAEGRTSQFVGTLPEGLAGKNVQVTIPNIQISGERFRLGFDSMPAQHDELVPAMAAATEVRDLYLTPGGIYTADDIIANGNMTAAEKFKGLVSSHDMKPKAGDKVCPITKTKANPKFRWIVGGKAYEFCCPPCVDEFVKTAKNSPNEIKEPADYVKQ